MKRCTRCELEKPLAAFSKASRSPDGFHWWCKECFATYYRATKPKTLARNKAWRESNPSYFADYHIRNRDQRLDRMREYRATHADELREYGRTYRQANSALLRALNRSAYQRRTGAPVIERVDRRSVLELGAGLCGICGDAVDAYDFHVDHIIPLARGGDHTYANTQPAHPFCNRSKGARMVEEEPGGISN